MKKLLLIIAIPLFLNSCTQKLSKEQSSQLWKAYKEQNYFKLNSLVNKIGLKGRNPDFILFKAKLGYVFNRPQESDSLINILLNKYSAKYNDSIIADLHLMKAVNNDRLQNYKNAFAEGKLVVEKYHHCYDSVFLAETRDDNEVREALIGAPKMGITKTTEERISLKRDIAGLMNLPVHLGSDSMDFVFDTGANISVIVASIAKKYGFKSLSKKVHILAFTGKRLDAELALVDFKLGNIRIKNSVFIVFPDSVLSFAKGAYVIKGVIGFPVMNALKEIILKDDKYLIVPQTPEKSENKNFALDQATPVILVNYKNDTLPFHFDTGADRTDLYVSFFERYKDSIKKTSKKKTNLIGGAGGTTKVETYVLDKIFISAGNASAHLDSLNILTKALLSNQAHLYGNFGQDFIKKYKVMKLNFEAMNITFSN